MKKRRQILKTSTASVLSCFLPIPTQDAGLLSAEEVEHDDEAFYAARYLQWSKEVENVWLELLGTGLKSLRPDVPTEDMREAINAWCAVIITSLEDRSFFRMEVRSFEAKKPMLTSLVDAIREGKAGEKKMIHCLDLLRLISPIHHFQESDRVDRNEPMTVVGQLMRLKRYHSETFHRLAGATLSLDAAHMKHELDEWSVQLEEEKRPDVLLQMNEGLALLRSEALIA